ncbi:MAG: S9 family peptidase [Melioribacteraceae bacterium]|nr:S9 family peptidase [Melioribacteraceae bacterium]MCF8355781.1 S9 family peptidase [Melioribacteraceae bacterium]MCF8392829.1 S9 family peptidase [Melioribacteraceae bacterium]MCF8418685.1 S9 family peptidase [Melioribacteraceae bacterium]
MLKIRTHIQLSILIFSGFILSGCNVSKQEAPVFPVEDFFRNAATENFQISPDGYNVAYLKPWNNRMNIYIQVVGEDTSKRITNSINRDITTYIWANDNQLIYIMDETGEEYYQFYRVNIDNNEQIQLTPKEKVKFYIVNKLSDYENEMIIMMNKRDPQFFDVYRMNVNTGELSLLQKNPGNITGWIADNDGVVKIARTTDGVNTGYLYRNSESENFNPVIVTDFKESLNPLIFTEDNQLVYCLSNIDRDKEALVLYDFKNAVEVEEIFEHYDADIEHVLFSNDGKPIAALYAQCKRYYKFFDPEWEATYKKISSKFKNHEVYISSIDNSEKNLILHVTNDRTFGTYYHYNIDSAKLTKLAEASPWLQQEYMAAMKPITYKARDGLTINGYLTLPYGSEAEDLPVIVYPHGGPWNRDYWEFNPTAQFLANRGYAVLQVNYRGSIGYGKEFLEAGFKEWGGKIQDDITDGVNWLIEQNIADPERIGIYGFSFGGYSALCGVTFHPDIYKCGVSYSGSTNIFTFFEAVPKHWEPFKEMMYEMVGNPNQDSLMIYNQSPYFFTEKIKAPLLIAHGSNDTRAPFSEIKNYIKLLEKNGVEVKTLFKKNEGHKFNNEENRLELYRNIESFLEDKLKGRKSM